MIAEAVDWLRDRHRLNVHMNWRTLGQVGVTRNTAVALVLNDVDLWTLLDQMADAVGSNVAVRLQRGVIVIEGIAVKARPSTRVDKPSQSK